MTVSARLGVKSVPDITWWARRCIVSVCRIHIPGIRYHGMWYFIHVFSLFIRYRYARFVFRILLLLLIVSAPNFFINEDFRRKDKSYLKTFGYAHNRKRKRLKYWILVGKMNTSCNISSRITCRRGTVVQQQDLPAAAATATAAAAGSSSKLQKQQAAESTKQKCGLSCALLGTRWNQRPYFFVVLFVRNQAEQQ